MARRIRNTTARSNLISTSKRKAAVHTVDGVRYKSKSLADLHRYLRGNPLVKSFHLPSIDEDNVNTGRIKSKECTINGYKFDSLEEGRFYVYLLEQQRNGFIKEFKNQVKFNLMPAYLNKFTNKKVRPIDYIADFVITQTNGVKEAIDVKGMETDVFKIKAKLFGSVYPNMKLTCYQWTEKYGSKWIDLDELKKLRKEAKKKQTSVKIKRRKKNG